MAHHLVTSADIPVEGERLEVDRLKKIRRTCLAVSVAGGVLSVPALLGWFGGGLQGSYSFSWLYGFFFFATIAMGGCFWTLLHNVSNSGWGVSVRRVMENVGYVFPWMFIPMLPFLLPEVQTYLYEWMDKHRLAKEAGGGSTSYGLHHGPTADHLLHVKYWYLNLEFWYVRMLCYFPLLGFVIYFLRKLSVDQDTDPTPGTSRLKRARFHSCWGVPVLAVVLTFLAIDVVKTLDYKWFSTMWGVYVFAGSALSAMAVIILVTIALRRMGYLKNVVGPEHDHLMGKLIFAFTVFWAYISFDQYFLYWYANITEETRYFILRNTSGWNYVSIVLVFGHFVVPFLLLIRQDLKRRNGYMIVMACYLLFMHMIDLYHMIIPERGPSVTKVLHPHSPDSWALWLNGSIVGDVVAFVTVGCFFVYILLRNIGSVALYPHRDPRILESANVHN
ncbi:MAG: hypothetical protein CMN04_07455 [Roseibacillus sp.]|nr:hypothetical protein [Roseibacillus sp.]|tara:strand:+ start:1604 stop:2941 length:1338 start_codon:yes stop_codon:yes gene_type:complete